MDADRFDAIVLSLAANPSRRSLTRAIAALTIGGAFAALGEREDAVAACTDSGDKCRRDEQCCSGNCIGKKRKRRCRSTPGALGCTIEDQCKDDIRCPDSPDDPDHFCAITIDGKPFCGSQGECFDCVSNKQCVDEFQQPGARCVYCCEEYNTRACVWFIE